MTVFVLTSGGDWYSRFLEILPHGKIFSLRAVFDGLPRILSYLPVTISLTLFGALLGLVLGLLFAIIKINKVPVLYQLQTALVSFLRGTPILVQLMLTYYGIPLVLRGINAKFGTSFNINEVPAYLFVITTFAFNEAAYASETIRAAILSVDAGEIEAARSLGMTDAQVYRRVIIPNAAVVATPSLINSLIGLTKGTSLAFNAGIAEIFAEAQVLGGRDYRYFERIIAVSLIYWLLNIGIEFFGHFVEKLLSIPDPQKASVESANPVPGGDR